MNRAGKVSLVALAVLFVAVPVQAQVFFAERAEAKSSHPANNVMNLTTGEGEWMSGAWDNPPWVKFYFGDTPCILGGMTVVNFIGTGDDYTSRGVGLVEIFASADGVNFNIPIMEHTFLQTNYSDPQSQWVPISYAEPVMGIMFVIRNVCNSDTIMFPGNIGDSFEHEVQNVGLHRITFTAVPEPATMSLLALSGLALLRRRK